MTDQVDRLTTALAARYTIERELGSGGMATVYLSEDVKHERKVALKVLKPELAAVLGGERFLREIKLTARFNHPHILPLLDSGEADHVLFYVMPYVAGESLRQKLNRETQLSIDEALRLTQQVAAALHHAHQQGIMHRDIKPENILLHEGEAMVADFGIALALNTAGGDRLTETGLSIGTPEYMSPEQASGAKDLDARSDVYALGCVLHEMLVGDPPFTGQTPQAIIARQVLDPPLSIRTVRSSVPPAVEEVVQRALAKAPADRWQTAEEFAAQLTSRWRSLGESAVQRTPQRPVVARSSMRGAATAVVALIAAVVVGFIGWGRIGLADRLDPIETQLTFSGRVDWAEISPDGQFLAYVEEVEQKRLLIQDLTGGTLVEVATLSSTDHVMTLRWFPDGSSLLLTYGSDRWTTVVYPRLGGTPRVLPDTNSVTALAPDGLRLASWWPRLPSGPSPIRVSTLSDNADQTLPTGDSIGLLWEGDWDPTGDFLTINTLIPPTRFALWNVVLEDSEWHRLTHDSVYISQPRWSPAGDAVYFFRGDPVQQLRKIRVGSDGRARGTAEVLEVGPFDAKIGSQDRMSLTQDGRKLVYVKPRSHSNLWRVRTATRQFPEQITRGTTFKSAPAISPDGDLLAYLQNRGGDRADVFVIPTQGGEPRALTTDGDASWFGPWFAPAWSPDGSTIAYTSAQPDGKVKVRTVPLEGGSSRTFEDTDMFPAHLAWAPGERILYSSPDNRNLLRLDTNTGAAEPLVANDSVGWIFEPQYSPDGQHVVVHWNRPPHGGIWIISLEDLSQRFANVEGFWQPLAWSADGQTIYVREAGTRTIAAVPASGEGHPRVVATTPFEDAVPRGTDCVPEEVSEGLVLWCSVTESVRDVWMIENFDPDVR